MKAIIELKTGKKLTWKIEKLTSTFGKLYRIDQKFAVNSSLRNTAFPSPKAMKEVIEKSFNYTATVEIL